MKLIELHILQSFPVSCLNRDDVGSPKSAVFGGVTRARISSQCLKRAARIYAKETWPESKFDGIRTRNIQTKFKDALLKHGQSDDEADKNANALAATYSTIDGEKNRVKTPVFLSPHEIDEVTRLFAIEGLEPKKAAKKSSPNDAADICLFGRMVANDPTLNVEGAAMFSHALSTHQANNEVDFFSAVGDFKDEQIDDAGADHIGSLEFNSATYYRYVAINLDLLAEKSHLGGLGEDERKVVLRSFIKAVLTAVPNARKNSMNAGTLPSEVLGIHKEKGQPLQLVNAFETPVKNRDEKGKVVGYAETSLNEMKTHLGKIEGTWGDQGEKHYLTETEGGLDVFIEALLKD